MMRIAFDQQTFTWQEYGGISRYFCRLATRLSEIHGVEAKIFAPIHINAYLPGISATIRTGIKVNPIPKTLRIMRNASRLMAIPLMQAFKPDIVHETYYSSWAFAPKGACRVITAYDMIQEYFPGPPREKNKFIRMKMEAFNRADHIICISENTRRDLMELYDIPAAKVSVVYLGFDMLSTNTQVNHNLQSLPYILYVGQRAGYKNFIDFLRAYASSEWLQNNFRILCFGGGKFNSAEKGQFNSIGVNESHIQQISGDDSILASCYRYAAAFVFPSLYEGFGLPPLEAMAAGCPVVCSNTSSIPEVVGSAGEYFDPTSIDSIRSSLENVLQSSERRAELVAHGIERCKLFTWEKCAIETLTIYRSIYN
jgi:glycosyltransferase involved in cell wall biosynthesis